MNVSALRNLTLARGRYLPAETPVVFCDEAGNVLAHVDTQYTPAPTRVVADDEDAGKVRKFDGLPRLVIVLKVPTSGPSV